MRISYLEKSILCSLFLTLGAQLECSSVVHSPLPKKSSVTPSCQSYTSSQRAYVKHIESKGIGYNEGYTTLGAFLTPAHYLGSTLPFLDLRAHVFNNGRFASNVGIGARYLSDTPIIYGGQFFYDFRRTHRQSYNQIGIGFEVLGNRWETRLNGYLPVGDKKDHHTEKKVFLTFDQFLGNELFFFENIQKKKYEFAMKGADAEAGIHLIKPTKNYTLYAGIGPYYYDGYFGKHAWGGKARVQAKLTEYLFVEISDSYDRIFHNKFQGQVSISVPFGKKLTKKPSESFKTPCSDALALQDRILLPTQRQEIIVVDKHTRKEIDIFTLLALSGNGSPLHFLFVSNTNMLPGQNGTFENPFNTLAAAQAASVPGDFIYVFAGDGTTTGMNAGFTFQDNQELLGSGIPETVTTQLGPVTIPPFTPTVPEITNTGVVITFGNNDILSGFTVIQNSANPAISAPNVASPAIRHVTVTMGSGAAGQPGISIHNPTGAPMVVGTHLTGNMHGGPAVMLTGNTPAQPVIQGNTIIGWTAGALSVQTTGNGQMTPSISDNVMTGNNGATTVLIESLGTSTMIATLSGNNITGNTATTGAVAFSTQNNSTITANVTTNSVSGNVGNGIDVSVANSSSTTIGMTGNTLTGNMVNGIAVDVADSAILQTNMDANNLSSNVQRGLDISYAAGAVNPQVLVNLNFNSITSNGSDGIVAVPNNGLLTMAIVGNIMTGNGDGSAGVISNAAPSASTCLRVQLNQGVDDLFLDNSLEGTFNLEPLFGNSISINEAGTITNVSEGTCQ